jgi:hypothetical protein
MRELGSIGVMCLRSASRVTFCPSGCLSMRTSLEEGIKPHRLAGIFPEQFLTEAGRNREAVVAADQRMVIRCFRDDFAVFVHDVFHVPLQSTAVCPGHHSQMENRTPTINATLKMSVAIPAASMMEARVE